MRTTVPLLAIAVFASACGTVRSVTQVQDDVYDIPDRTPVVAAAQYDEPGESFVEDYYDPNDSGKYDLDPYDQRTYNDITYNDPQWYNSTRFGFGVGVSSWGPSYGMSMNYGYPGPYGDPFGYPYGGTSWMIGYGTGGYPSYGYGGYGSPYMGMGMYYGMGGYPYYGGGYYPYGGCGSCYGCGVPYNSNGAVVQHRPSLSGGGGQRPGTNTLLAPPSRYRSSASNFRPTEKGSGTRSVNSPTRSAQERTRTSNGSERSSGGSRNQGTRSTGGDVIRGGGSLGGGIHRWRFTSIHWGRTPLKLLFHIMFCHRSRGLLLAITLLISLLGNAQNEEDALRYSWTQPGGTARSWGLGGAMGAVGADPGSASLNPAGFALYNTSEFSFTPGLEVNNAEELHYGTVNSGSATRAFVNNFAAVLYNPGRTNSSWRSTVFGVSFDREATYHADRPAVGDRVNSTILQGFVNEADGTDPADLYNDHGFTSSLAWDTYAIDPLDTTSNTYISQIPYGSDVRQSHSTLSSGRSQTTSLFFAANWMDKLYLGASMGIVGVRYDRTTSHSETTLVDSLPFKDLSYVEELITTGGGLDLKVGVVGRLTDRLRLGISYHSPKWLMLDDVYYTRMATTFRTPDSEGQFAYAAQSPDGLFSYQVNTPWSLLASAAYLAGKNGLVSVDYGYQDYRTMRLKRDNTIPDSYDFKEENIVISEQFIATHSVRVGTEWRMGNWYYRGGWGWWQDPYSEKDARHGSGYKRYTVGAGYRTAHLSVDLALNYGRRTTNYFQYDPALVKATNETLTDFRSLVTIAYRP